MPVRRGENRALTGDDRTPPPLARGSGPAQMAGRGGGFGVRGIILLLICGVVRRWRQADA